MIQKQNPPNPPTTSVVAWYICNPVCERGGMFLGDITGYLNDIPFFGIFTTQFGGADPS